LFKSFKQICIENAVSCRNGTIDCVDNCGGFFRLLLDLACSRFRDCSHNTRTLRSGCSREKKTKGKAKGKPKGKEGTDGEGNGEEALERTTDGGGSGEAEGDCPEAGEEKAKKSGFSFRSVFRRDTEVEVAPVEPPEESESSASPREAGEDGDPDRGAKDKDKDKEKGKKGRSSLFGSVFGRHPSPPALRDADHAGPLSESRGSVGNLSAGELGEQPARGEGERSPEESPPTKSEKGKKEKFSLLSVFSLSSSPKRPEGEEPAAAAKKKDKAKGGAALL